MLFGNIPFAKVRSVLVDVGFVEREIENKYLSFSHAESDTFFVFFRYRARDKVSMADLVMGRKQLDWNGVLSEEAFDASLRKASA